MTITTAKIFRTSLITGLICGHCMFSPAVLHAQEPSSAPGLSAIHHIGIVSKDNRNPVVAYSHDGNHLYVCWDGVVQNNRRILMRERVGDEWLAPVIVDENPAGSNEFPNIVIDKTGAPHVAWISSINGKRIPNYARRIGRAPNTWHSQTIPFPKDSTISGSCDYLNLQLDANQQPWIVWQYGYGSVYSIAASHFNDQGQITSTELTPGATSHNLDPKIFFLPEPTVYWYVSQSDQFYLVGSQHNQTTSDWEISPPENLENLPADSLPELFKTSEGPFAAIWYDQATLSLNGESAEHVFLGVQSPETKGRGEAIDDRHGSDYHSVVGTSYGDSLITAWVSESYDEGAQVYMGLGSTPDKVVPTRVSQSPFVINSNPSLAASSTQAAVAWEEDNGTGTSLIALRTLEF